METFTVDKSFYDIGASDLKELWDSDLVDPVSLFLGNLFLYETTCYDLSF